MQLNEIAVIQRNSAEYPANLKTHQSKQSPDEIYTLGDFLILKQKKLAVFCSKKYPGTIIMQMYDVMRSLRKESLAVIGGFHSPMEQECLNILFRGKASAIVCPARALHNMRIRKEFRGPLGEGRLLLLLPFQDHHNRISLKNSTSRNYFVAAVADAIIVTYAAPQSKTEEFCGEIISWGKPVYTLKSEENKKLIEMGAIPVSPEQPVF